MSRISKRILERKAVETQAKTSHMNTTDMGSNLQTRVDTRKGSESPISRNKSGVYSDFVNLPTSSAKQFKRKGDEYLPADNIVTPYQHEIRFHYDSQSQDEILIRTTHKDRLENLLGKTAGTTTTGLTNTGKHSPAHRHHQFIDTLNPTDLSKNTESEINSSINRRLGETDTIEKVINGDYEDDDNINYYSVGHKNQLIKTTREDIIIDPFYRKSDSHKNSVNDDEFQTARLHGERHTGSHSRKSSREISYSANDNENSNFDINMV